MFKKRKKSYIMDPHKARKDNLSHFNKGMDLSIWGDNHGGIDELKASYLYGIVAELQPKNIVELGTWRGMSAYVMLCASLWDKTKIVSYDIEEIKGIKKFKDIDYRVIHPDRIKNDLINEFSNPFMEATDKDVCFVDDHQDQYERLIILNGELGFKNFIFDDNIYPEDKHNYKNPPSTSICEVKDKIGAKNYVELGTKDNLTFVQL